MGFLRCCVYYGILAVVSFFIGRLLPKSWFHGDKFLLCSVSCGTNHLAALTREKLDIVNLCTNRD